MEVKNLVVYHANYGTLTTRTLEIFFTRQQHTERYAVMTSRKVVNVIHVFRNTRSNAMWIEHVYVDQLLNILRVAEIHVRVHKFEYVLVEFSIPKNRYRQVRKNPNFTVLLQQARVNGLVNIHPE